MIHGPQRDRWCLSAHRLRSPAVTTGLRAIPPGGPVGGRCIELRVQGNPSTGLYWEAALGKNIVAAIGADKRALKGLLFCSSCTDAERPLLSPAEPKRTSGSPPETVIRPMLTHAFSTARAQVAPSLFAKNFGPAVWTCSLHRENRPPRQNGRGGSSGGSMAAEPRREIRRLAIGARRESRSAPSVRCI
jgi:hypothetical protein